MNKPTVFFSHSSRDAVPLARLRDLVLAKTGNSVQIFLSSDGQSIPFGRNWVHSVEAALNDAKLMFVFLSPYGLAKPGWVNFESGHAYSRSILVVPVGVFGVRIEHVPPPLSLLHGFNVTDPPSASNIIAVINRTFELSHPDEITTDEFNRIFAGSGVSALSIFGDLTPFVYELRVSTLGIGSQGLPLKEELKAVADHLSKLEVTHSYKPGSSSATLTAHGVSFECQYSDMSSNYMIIRVDPLISQHSLPLLDSIRHLMPSLFDTDATALTVELTERVGELSGAHRVTSRLYNTEVSLCAKGDYQFRNCSFRIGHNITRKGLMDSHRGNSYVHIRASTTAFEEIPLHELLRILFDSGVLYVSDEDSFE